MRTTLKLKCLRLINRNQMEAGEVVCVCLFRKRYGSGAHTSLMYQDVRVVIRMRCESNAFCIE